MEVEAAIAHPNLLGIALVVLAALICGLGLERLRQPAVIGYIVAGVLLGPSGFGLVEDRANIDTLAELGVLMLLFVIGMELSVRAFRQLWRLYVVTTLFQVGLSTAVMVLLAKLFSWPTGLGFVLGFAVALSSTAVAIKVLQDLGELRSRVGRITVGILIAQDLAVVPMMLTIAALSGSGFRWIALLKILISVGLIIGLILWLSRGPKVRLPFSRWVGGHDDLTPLAALAFCFGAAALSGLLGMSAAYGAFLAGLVIGNSHERHALVSVTRPIQSVLMMAFFLSIGLLIDLSYLWHHKGAVLLLLFLVAFFKTALNIGILRLMGQPWTHAFLAAVVMAQIGEFSFLLSLTAVQRGLIDEETTRLVVAVAALSLTLSPLWVITARRLLALAAPHIGSASEVLHLVYGREADAVVGTLGGASSRAMEGIRRLAAAYGAARDRRQVPAVAAESPPEPTVSPETAASREGEPHPAAALQAAPLPQTTTAVRNPDDADEATAPPRTPKPKGRPGRKKDKGQGEGGHA